MGKQKRYEFTDDVPFQGSSLYRIRYTDKEGTHTYSDSASLHKSGLSFFSFYPNPVDNVLIIRAEAASEMAVTDGFGKQRIARSIGTKPSIIDVSGLEKGVYLLRVTNKTTGQQQAEKFIKN